MNDFLNRLLGIGDGAVGFGREGVEFGFARPLPPWAWALAIAAAFTLAGWSYWRLDGQRRWRATFSVVRGMVLLLILFLFSGPQLVKPNERVENDWVLVLLDRSASLTIADAPGGAASPRITRDAQLREALTTGWPAFTALARDRTVQWLGFDSGTYEVQPVKDGAPVGTIDLPMPSGRRTSLGAALDQALARAAARPVSGVIVISDGRSVDEPGRQALRRLQSERIPVYTLALGSPEPIADLSLERAESPALAFVNDTVPVSVEVERLGSAERALGGKVQLVDKLTGRVLDERPLPPQADPQAWTDHRARLTLTSKPSQAGKFDWVVRVVPDSPDLIEQNNQAALSIELVDRPLRVLYFDGYPRWEYRYLKNLLVREHSIQSAALLLAPNRQYLREGDLPLDSLPRSPEEWARFDVIVLGDLAPTLFSREQLEQVREHVSVRGAGLLWIGGPGSTPGAWRDTPLADLLPFSLGGGGAADGGATVRAFDDPVVMSPAPAARRLSLLELGETPEEGWPARLSDPATGWSQLQYAQRIDPAWVKPTAEVLATFTATPAGEAPAPGAETTPAVLSMRYGAGRVLYVATDEIWRWRFARGEALPERFWLPLLRLQGRESLARASRPAILEVTPRRAEVEQPVRVAVRILDQSLADAAPASLTARIRPAPGGPGAEQSGPQDMTLAPEQAEQRGERSGRSYATTWVPSQPGRYLVEVADPALAGASLTGEVEVAFSDDELRRPEADHALLARLSEQTEGRVLTVAELPELPRLLPKREVHVAGTPDIQTLWDRPAALILLLLLLGAEWIGRRLIKLP